MMSAFYFIDDIESKRLNQIISWLPNLTVARIWAMSQLHFLTPVHACHKIQETISIRSANGIKKQFQ